MGGMTSWLVLFVKLLAWEASGQTLKGYHFLDNQLDLRFGSENGYATFNTGKPIPDQVGRLSIVCNNTSINP